MDFPACRPESDADVVDSSVIVLDGGPVIVYSYASLLSAAKLKLSTSSSVVVSAPLSVSKRLSVVQVTYE